MKFKSILLYLLLGFILSGCVAAGISSVGLLGKSVSVALDPRTVGTQVDDEICLLYTSPSPRDVEESRMPSSAWKKNQ